MENMKPPILPFDAFIGILDELKDNGIPDFIKSYTFNHRSTHHSQQMFSACKFLGLVNEDGKPTYKLDAVVFSGDGRPEALQEILISSYQPIFAHPVEKISQDDLSELFTASYGVTADTRKKSKTFFVKACQFAEIVLSESILRRVRGKSSETENGLFKAQESVNITARTNDSPDNKMEITIEAQSGAVTMNAPANKNDAGLFTHTINLKSGGTLMLSAAVDVWQLDKNDRDFVFKVVDDMKEYAKT